VTEIRHGYTLADVDRLARYAVRTDYLPSEPDWPDRVAEARCVIVERLLTTVTPPAQSADLVRIGRRASLEYVRRHMSHRGWRSDRAGGSGASAAFQRYWTSADPAPMEERIVDRLAVQQILPMLSPSQRETLAALAAVDDQARAAQTMGLDYSQYRGLLNRSRRLFRAWWHEHERPSGVWRDDRRNGARTGLDSLGRPRITVSELDAIRGRRDAGETLDALAAERGITRQALGRLLLGKTRPAPDPIGAPAPPLPSN